MTARRGAGPRGRAARLAVKALRRATSRVRLLPDFLVIGAQKGGTTALYDLLSAHPWVAPAATKEVHFFDYKFARGPGWYRASFPTAFARARARAAGADLRTGEASPYYLFHPLAPERVARMCPRARLLAVLRDPVERAWSHYHHNVALGLRDPVRDAITGRESLSFEEAVEREEERLRGEEERLVRDPAYVSFTHLNYGYLARGRYLEQLRRWWRWFPRERLLVLSSDTFRHDPARLLGRVLSFLGLPAWEPASWPRSNVASYPPMPGPARERLAGYFAPHNRALAAELGEDFGWGG